MNFIRILNFAFKSREMLKDFFQDSQSLYWEYSAPSNPMWSNKSLSIHSQNSIQKLISHINQKKSSSSSKFNVESQEKRNNTMKIRWYQQSAEHTLTQLGKLWFEFFPPSRCACSLCQCGVVDDIYTERQQNGRKRENFITSNFTFIFRPSILVIKKLSLFLKDAKSFLVCRAESHGDEVDKKFEVFWNFNWPHFQCTLWHSREKLFRCSSDSSVSYMKFFNEFWWKCWINLKSLILTTLSDFRQNFHSDIFRKAKDLLFDFPSPSSSSSPCISRTTALCCHLICLPPLTFLSLSLCLSTLATSRQQQRHSSSSSISKAEQNTIVESGENRVGMKMREKSSMMWGRTGRVRNGKAAQKEEGKSLKWKLGWQQRGGEKSFNSHSSRARVSFAFHCSASAACWWRLWLNIRAGIRKKRRWLSWVFVVCLRCLYDTISCCCEHLPKSWRRKEATPTQLCKEFSLFFLPLFFFLHADFFPSPTEFSRPLSPPSKHPCRLWVALSLEKALREVLKSFLLRSFSRWNDSQADDV